jgi:DNA modification methylase
MSVKILIGDVRENLRALASDSIHCIVTSPPYYGLRDYGVEGQIGLEATPAEFLSVMVEVFEEVRRVLREDGSCWVNMGDSFIQKSLYGMPWRFALALKDSGWYLRRDIIWSKPNPMPESCRDRCTTAHEYIFMFTKSPKYFYDRDAIAEPCVWDGIDGETNGVSFGHGMDAHDRGRGRIKRPDGWPDRKDTVPTGFRNKRSVWEIATRPFSDAHFATFPPALAETCIKAGCQPDGIVLDPFFGAGTTGLVADRLQRDCIGIELNPLYAEMALKRIQGDSTLFADISMIKNPTNPILPNSIPSGFDDAQRVSR